MEDIHLDQTLPAPLYRQIAEQIKQLIARELLRSGERLPPTRQLARSLGVNQNTVVRAYMELEKERIVVARRGGGTIVSVKSDDPNLMIMREQRLASIIGNSMVEALSSGYSLEELDVTFHLQLSRWREQKKRMGESASHQGKGQSDFNTIRISGSHDLALDILVSQAKSRESDIDIEVAHTGSMGGLIALKEGSAHLAGIHLLDEETGEYNYAYVKHIFPGQEMTVLHLAYRVQGLMFARNNPQKIKGLEDLARKDITFINRQSGSGTRVLLDFELRRRGIKPADVRGYENELDTHVAVAMTIEQGKADAGLGIEAAARSCNLDFLPLFRERYDLVTYADIFKSALLSPVIDIITGEDFKQKVNNMGGYDTSQTGNSTFC